MEKWGFFWFVCSLLIFATHTHKNTHNKTKNTRLVINRNPTHGVELAASDLPIAFKVYHSMQ